MIINRFYDDDFDKRLETFTEYMNNLKKIRLLALTGIDRKQFYDDIKIFFEELELELFFIDEIPANNNHNYRISSYILKGGQSIWVFELEHAPVISLTFDNGEILKNTAYYLIHLIKENLGVELSLKQK